MKKIAALPLLVIASTSISGIARVRPGGDLDMGDFTASASGAP